MLRIKSAVGQRLPGAACCVPWVVVVLLAGGGLDFPERHFVEAVLLFVSWQFFLK
ncbi:MAG: hypothetical protein ACXWJK_04865 [Burkholderiaceae bacterium]